MSQKSPEIGECPICLSNINISNIYAISKCGHTFHQKCIHQWIFSAKNCPTCRTNAIQSDIIKLFFQENNVENVIPKKEEILHGNSENFNFGSFQINIPEDVDIIDIIDNPFFIEEQYSQFGCYRIMKECKCESIRYKNGDLQYCCLTDVNVNIFYFEENGQITVILPGGFVIQTFPSTT